MAFVVTNVITNFIFALIFPVDTMEEIMVSESPKTDHTGPILITITILLPNTIPIQTQI